MNYSIICCNCLFDSNLVDINKNLNLPLICCENFQEFIKLRNKFCCDGNCFDEKWFHTVEDSHACFKFILTILRITKLRRCNFVNKLLNTNFIRVHNDNRWDFLPGVNCLQINDYNFWSMECPWQIDCIKFFCYGCQKRLCFEVTNPEFNRLDQTFIVKNDKSCNFFPCISYGCWILD